MFNFITLNILTYIIIILAVFVLILCILLIRLEFRFRKMLLGKNAKTLEDTINIINSKIKNLHTSGKEIEDYLVSAEKRIKRSVQGVATVRFNPFKGTGSGGNQSFATAFVNEDGNGVVLSSLYSRDRVSVYSKPLIKYKSEFELTKEEKEAVRLAKQSLHV